MMTIEEYRAAVLQALLDAKNEDGTPAITRRKHRRRSTDLPTMSCRMESFGIRRRTWLKLSSKDKENIAFLCTIQLLFVILQPLKTTRFLHDAIIICAAA